MEVARAKGRTSLISTNPFLKLSIEALMVESVFEKSPAVFAISNPTPKKLKKGIRATAEPTPPIEKMVEITKVKKK